MVTKRQIEDILNDSKNIDPNKIANEVLTWTINNVSNFIDNHTKIFKLDLTLDDSVNSVGMEETKKLQDLYQAIPEDKENEEEQMEKAEKCRRSLDEITLKSHECMKESKELLKNLFKAMIFYYEKVIPSPENKRKALEIDEKLKELFNQKEQANEQEKINIQEKIVALIKEGESLIKFEELEGVVGVSKFEYDAFEVGVQVKRPKKDNNEEKEVVKEYIIPEGFVLWIEINYHNKNIRPTVMF